MEDVPVDEVEKRKFIEIKYNKFSKLFNLYSRTVDRYAPFYKENFYQSFISVRDICSKLGRIFKRYNYDIKYNLSCAMVRDATMTKDEIEETHETPKNHY